MKTEIEAKVKLSEDELEALNRDPIKEYLESILEQNEFIVSEIEFETGDGNKHQFTITHNGILGDKDLIRVYLREFPGYVKIFSTNRLSKSMLFISIIAGEYQEEKGILNQYKDFEGDESDQESWGKHWNTQRLDLFHKMLGTKDDSEITYIGF